MEIQVYGLNGVWHFSIHAKHRLIIAKSSRGYANERNAVQAAKLIAKGKIKVVVK